MEEMNDPALERALLERIDRMESPDGEEIRRQEDREDFGLFGEMKRSGLIEAEEKNPATLVVHGLTEKGRRRLHELREQNMRPW